MATDRHEDSYRWFAEAVIASGFTVEQVRFDVPPPDGVLDLLEAFGDDYETFALRWASEQTGQRSGASDRRHDQ